MADVGSIITALQGQYPVPKIDPQWVRECYQALIEDGQQPTIDAMHEQYLFSDLSQSTISPPASLIPANPHGVLLFPQPTLLQIISITEIGSSAFQLQTVAEQRKDILSGQTLIRRMDDEVDEDEDDEADKGKLPVYPRGMLKFELSVGDGRLIKAIEYRRLEGIKLGETGLGAKILVQHVKALRGILMLEPANAEFVGMLVDHLESEQPANFLAGLARRMGKPVPGQDPSVAPEPQRRQRLPPAVRDQQSGNNRNGNRNTTRSGPIRPRETQTRLSFSPSKSPVKSDDDVQVIADTSTPISARRPSRAASHAASARVAGLYQQTRLLDGDMIEPTPSKRTRTTRQISRMAPPARPIEDEEDDFDMEFDDSFLRQVDAVAATASSRPSQPQEDPDVDEWDYVDDDSSFIRHIDEVEAQAQARTAGSTSRRHATTTGTTSRFFDRGNTTRNTHGHTLYVDSDEGSGKENKKPNPIEVVYISD